MKLTNISKYLGRHRANINFCRNQLEENGGDNEKLPKVLHSDVTKANNQGCPSGEENKPPRKQFTFANILRGIRLVLLILGILNNLPLVADPFFLIQEMAEFIEHYPELKDIIEVLITLFEQQ